MPPVLHVAFAELAAGAAQQMLAGGPRRGVEQRRRVLQLVAEAVRAAGLVVPAASPVAAGQRLVLQPAVDQQVQGGVGRLGVDHAQRPFPEFPDALQGLARAGRAAEPPDQLLGLVGIVAGAQHEDQFALLRRRPGRTAPAAPRRGRGPRRSGRTGARGASRRDLASVPLRPRNSVRLPVTVRAASLTLTKTVLPANSRLYTLRANSAPVFGSISVTTCIRFACRHWPSTNSQ